MSKKKQTSQKHISHTDIKLWAALEKTLDAQYLSSPTLATRTTRQNVKTSALTPKQSTPQIERPTLKPKTRPPTSITASLDKTIANRLKRGKTAPKRKLDLHGETQDSAYAKLKAFINAAQTDGVNLVIVVTGKGERGEGVLKTKLPQWLGSPPFTDWVISHQTARPEHGGSGARYVHVRTKKR